jgi:hypothetical protein
VHLEVDAGERGLGARRIGERHVLEDDLAPRPPELDRAAVVLHRRVDHGEDALGRGEAPLQRSVDLRSAA